MPKKILIDLVYEDVHQKIKLASIRKNTYMRLYVFDAIMLKIFMDENPEIERENLPTWFTEKGEPKYNTRWEETISKI